MKKFIVLSIIACSVSSAFATPFTFTDTLGQSASIDVDYWTGTGQCETILVVDWNQSGDYISESHAFGYRWDGAETTVLEMLNQITAGGDLLMTTGYGGGFVVNLFYDDADGDHHAHDEEGSFNLASTGDVFARWGNMDSSWTKLGDWDANMAGIGEEFIADGQLEGINVMYWFDSSRPYENLDVPFAQVPEPATIAMLSLGLFGLRSRVRS